VLERRFFPLDKVFEKWLTDPYFDASTHKELAEIRNNNQEVEERFYRMLEFGTGGLRGIIGAGTNRINKYIIRQVTQGLASYIATHGQTAKARGVVIAHDSRHFSREFSIEAALVLAQNGIKAYVFDDLRPTPELSFAVRELGTVAGIMVTASHNPPQYNGYKVYWEDGGQISLERAEGILACIKQVEDITTVLPMDLAEARATGLYHEVGEDLDQKYLKCIKSLVINPDVIHDMSQSCKILYSPLHGSGNILVRRALAELDFNHVTVVPEQELPDPNFSTVKSPNPEEPEAFTLALKMAETLKPDVILATDPDADRIGVVVKTDSEDYKLLTGNQTGVLLTHYILSQLQQQNRLPSDGVVIKTIVTTDMAIAVANAHAIEVEQTLTGFKFIGEKIHEFEAQRDKTFLFGFEESYGYLAGTFVRDKDAVCAAVLISEAAAYYKSQGKTLYGILEELWAKYGYYREALHTITLEGKTGSEQTRFLMQKIRDRKITDFAGFKVSHIEDYQSGNGIALERNSQYRLTLPISDVVKFKLANGGFVVFRPSGTEPKAKVYISLASPSLEESIAKVESIKQYLLTLVKEILAEF
jgi:phosphoglucomutase